MLGRAGERRGLSDISLSLHSVLDALSLYSTYSSVLLFCLPTRSVVNIQGLRHSFHAARTWLKKLHFFRLRGDFAMEPIWLQSYEIYIGSGFQKASRLESILI
jgi:hypothetical protein